MVRKFIAIHHARLRQGFDRILRIVVAAEQHNRSASHGLGKLGPKNLVLLQAFHSSAEDQSSASAAESGCHLSASRIALYSCFRIASLTACRMNSVRCRFDTGAILFKVCIVASSSCITIDAIRCHTNLSVVWHSACQSQPYFRR